MAIANGLQGLSVLVLSQGGTSCHFDNAIHYTLLSTRWPLTMYYGRSVVYSIAIYNYMYIDKVFYLFNFVCG